MAGGSFLATGHNRLLFRLEMTSAHSSPLRRLVPLFKRFVPGPVLRTRSKIMRARMQARNTGRSSAEVFSEIYSKQLWGGADGELCSGDGSSGAAADAYCSFVARFIAEHDIASAVDIGCGDFRIGARIAPHLESYTGVDVAAPVIAHHCEHHAGPGRRFLQLDASEQPLPDADLCMVRQVLQHLSNTQIASMLPHLERFRYVLVTEHYPDEQHLVANRDKVHGADTRVVDGSAVILSAPPFNWYHGELLLSMPAGDSGAMAKETLRTFLYQPAF